MSTLPEPGSTWIKGVTVEVREIVVASDSSQWVVYEVKSVAKPYLALAPLGQFAAEYDGV